MIFRPMVLVALMLLCLSYSSTAFGVDKGKAKYIGGTIASIPEKIQGPIDLKGDDKLVFMPEEGSRLEIPWTSIEEIEYGQQAGRRWKTAILISPVALFSKGRKHYVTLSFKNSEGKDQGVVFEFDKSDIRQNLTIFKIRTGKDISFQDEEAKKQMGGGSESKK